ncbi:MAG: selB [Bacillales bacterium]|jgi:selenocysteine-specific elongation factor|nr:selB [Bacillales bacterium]
MEKKYYTIGTAGHIDHGKTTLIKTLTNVDTDRLKEEKERNISIELGFAPLNLGEDLYVSVIDVPGHEKFIRQMISGVTGIDLMLLIVAADEGVMPQTQEHLEILNLLEVKRGIVVITKIDKVDPELVEVVKEEIRDQLEGTIYYGSKFALVDSISGNGLECLKDIIKSELLEVKPKHHTGAFRMPIDQVFTVKGQGTVVRGTVYEGSVSLGDSITVMPENLKTKARQIQVFGNYTERVVAGQRAAINLANIERDEIVRGDVIVSSDVYKITKTIDVSLKIVKGIQHPLKQRTEIKVHIGTSEVMGNVVFFDRNEVKEFNDEILCQLRLDNEIVAKRGDRFIIRRPSPAETVGGGVVVDPNGDRYKFGEKTIEMLKSKKTGSPIERMQTILDIKTLLSHKDLITFASVSEQDILRSIDECDLIKIGNSFTTPDVILNLKRLAIADLNSYHGSFPLRLGLNKAELIQNLTNSYEKLLIEYVINDLIKEGALKLNEQFISVGSFKPELQGKWAKRMEQILIKLEKDSFLVKPFAQYVSEENLPENEAKDFYHFLINQGHAYILDPIHLISTKAVNGAVKKMKNATGDSFDLQIAKEVLGISRKYLVPLIELFDKTGQTKRVENSRFWLNK